MKLKVAVGTDDNKKFTNEHFGDSKYFLIYNWDDDGIHLVEERKNIKFDEETHGDAKKASHISNQLKDVNVLMAKVFGPNIVRIRKNYVPVVSRIDIIEEALNLLNSRKEEILENIEKEGDKDIIYLEK